MDLFHFHDPHGNFGDDLNHWIWDGLMPGWREALPGQVLVGVGTLINAQLPRGRPKVVVGSGVGYGPMPDAELLAECRFLSVRGPRSAAALHLSPDKGIIDPAIMLPEFPEFQGIAEKSGPPIFVPHYRSRWRQDWQEVCAAAGMDYVSPSDEAKVVIRRLAAAPLVVAESMHAAIIADAFGTPWRPAVIAYDFLPSKWQDWAESLDIELPDFPHLEPFSDRLRRLSGGRAPVTPTTKAPAGMDGSAARKPPSGLRQRLRRVVMRLDARQLPKRLRALSQEEGTLSDRARLEEARARYRKVLEELQAEF